MIIDEHLGSALSIPDVCPVVIVPRHGIYPRTAGQRFTPQLAAAQTSGQLDSGYLWTHADGRSVLFIVAGDTPNDPVYAPHYVDRFMDALQHKPDHVIGVALPLVTGHGVSVGTYYSKLDPLDAQVTLCTNKHWWDR